MTNNIIWLYPPVSRTNASFFDLIKNLTEIRTGIKERKRWGYN